jgi:hypothetical protein
VPLERVNHAAIGVLREPGVYIAEGGGARSTIAVNVGDAQVSNVGRTSLPAAGTRAVTAGASSHAWWMYCVIAAFALILAEWWTWQRRITVCMFWLDDLTPLWLLPCRSSGWRTWSPHELQHASAVAARRCARCCSWRWCFSRGR